MDSSSELKLSHSFNREGLHRAGSPDAEQQEIDMVGVL